MTRATYAHPVALGALALLLVNDHVLKARFPGAVTGKLSDVAGPVVLAALVGPLAARLARRRWAEAAAWWGVAVAFAAVKVVPVANDAAAALLTALAGRSDIVRDPSDVLGLLTLPVAWRLTRSAPVRAPRPLRVAAAVVACGAVMATSYAPEPNVVSLRVEGAEVVAVVDDYGDESAWRSADGQTWRPGASPAAPPDPGLACHERHCYRVTGIGSVEESFDSGVTWRESVPTPENGWLRPGVVVFVPGRDVAVVTVGEDGVLRRDGTGEWERVAVGPARPGGEPDPWPLPEAGPFLVALVVGLAGLTIVTIVMVVVSVRRRPTVPPPPGAWPFDGPFPPAPPPPPPPPPRRGRYRS